MSVCECDFVGFVEPERLCEYDAETERPFVNHKPHECLCTNNLRLFRRGDRTIWLCSCCNTSRDERISQ